MGGVGNIGRQPSLPVTLPDRPLGADLQDSGVLYHTIKKHTYLLNAVAVGQYTSSSRIITTKQGVLITHNFALLYNHID